MRSPRGEKCRHSDNFLALIFSMPKCNFGHESVKNITFRFNSIGLLYYISSHIKAEISLFWQRKQVKGLKLKGILGMVFLEGTNTPSPSKKIIDLVRSLWCMGNIMTIDETDFKVTKLRFLFGPTMAIKETRAVSKNAKKERALTTPKRSNLVIFQKYGSIPTVVGAPNTRECIRMVCTEIERPPITVNKIKNTTSNTYQTVSTTCKEFLRWRAVQSTSWIMISNLKKMMSVFSKSQSYVTCGAFMASECWIGEVGWGEMRVSPGIS